MTPEPTAEHLEAARKYLETALRAILHDDLIAIAAGENEVKRLAAFLAQFSAEKDEKLRNVLIVMAAKDRLCAAKDDQITELRAENEVLKEGPIWTDYHHGLKDRAEQAEAALATKQACIEGWMKDYAETRAALAERTKERDAAQEHYAWAVKDRELLFPVLHADEVSKNGKPGETVCESAARYIVSLESQLASFREPVGDEEVERDLKWIEENTEAIMSASDLKPLARALRANAADLETLKSLECVTCGRNSGGQELRIFKNLTTALAAKTAALKEAEKSSDGWHDQYLELVDKLAEAEAKLAALEKK